MASILDRYKEAKIRHPSWRIYKAIEDIKKMEGVSSELRLDLKPSDFGLKDGLDVYFPYLENDDPTDQLIETLLNPKYKDSVYCIDDCLTLFLDVKSRQPVECMLMSGMLAPDIAADLGYATHIVETYACIFFDTSVWRTDADRLAYVSRGVDGKDAETKRKVAAKGLDFVLVHDYDMPTRVKMDKALINLFAQMYDQTMQMMKSPDIEEQRVAQGWSKRVLEVFSELKNATKDEGGIKELTIALQTSPAPKRSVEDL